MEASAPERPKRVDVGFAGGQVLSVRMQESVYGELRTEIERKGHGWYTLRTEDSEVAVDLEQVVYVRLETERHRVGF
jgi:hypothetical protein